jgi:hypothetical protein
MIMKKFPSLSFRNYIVLTVVMLIAAFTACKKDKEIPNKVATLKTPGILNQPLNLSNGLIGYWPLAGNGNDLSGLHHTSTLYDVDPTTDHLGTPNAALLFNGTSSKIVIAEATDLHLYNTDFTISAWVRLDSYSNGPNSSILSKRGGPVYDPGGYMMAVTGETVVHGNPTTTGGIARYYNGNLKITNDGQTTSLWAGGWHNYIIIYNNSNHQMWEYIDGSLVSYISNNGGVEGNFYDNVLSPANTSYPLIIGFDQTSGSGSYFQGAMSDVRIYNRELTPSEINTIAGIPLEGPFQTVYNYTVDESASPWIDANLKIRINGTEVVNELFSNYSTFVMPYTDYYPLSIEANTDWPSSAANPKLTLTVTSTNIVTGAITTLYDQTTPAIVGASLMYNANYEWANDIINVVVKTRDVP